MDLMHVDRLAYLTDTPGIGGQIKRRPEDFLVDEIPAYEPCGEGEHLYLVVEKRRRLTTDVVRLLSGHLGVPWKAIGYAGLKDKHAITRQSFSVHGGDEARLATFSDDHIKVLGVSRHTNKIKRGHLRGNRFAIKIREVDPSAVVRVKPLLEAIEREGVANYLGEQRFGYRRNNHVLGKLLLEGKQQEFLDELLGRPTPDEAELPQQARAAYERGDYKAAIEIWPKVHRFERQAVGPLSRGAPPGDAINGIDDPQLSLLVSSFQSAIFNWLLDRRIREGRFSTLLEGDVAMKHATRGLFTVREVGVEQPRYEAKEISPTGPMWGPKMKRASGEVDQWERDALAATGVSLDQIAASKYAPDGSRRTCRMLVDEPEVSGGVDEHGPYVRVAFTLSRGCFATTVLREIMKTGDSDDPASEDAADDA